MKYIKKILKILSIFFLLIFIVLLLLPFVFKGKLIDSLKSEINTNINAKVNFNNDIGLSFIKSFPNVNVNIKDFLIKGLNEYENDTLLFFPETDLNLNFMSLIRGNEMVVNKIFLAKPIVNLLVSKEGVANWDIIKPKKDNTADTNRNNTSIKLSKLSIENGNFNYLDKKLNFRTTLSNFNHTLNGKIKGSDYNISIVTHAPNFNLSYGGIHYINDVNTNLEANLNIDLENMRFDFKENQLKLNELPLSVDGFFDINDENYDMDLDVKMLGSKLKNVLSLIPVLYQNNFKDMDAKGDVNFKCLVKGKYTDKKIPSIDFFTRIKNGNFKYVGMQQSAEKINFDLKVKNSSGVYDATVVNLKDFTMIFAGEQIKVNAEYKTPYSNPYINASVLGDIDLDKIKNIIPLESKVVIKGRVDSDIKIQGHIKDFETNNYEEYKAEGKLLISDLIYHNIQEENPLKIKQAEIKLSPKYLEVIKSSGSYGKSDFDISGKINNGLSYVLKDEELSGNLKLKSNYLNINSMFSDKAEQTDSAQVSSFSIPENLNLKLMVDIKEMIYDIYNLKNSFGGMSLVNGKIVFDKLRTETMGGKLKLNGLFDSKDELKPFTDITFNASSFNMLTASKKMSLIKNYAPILEKASGLFDLNLKMSGFLDKNLNPVYSSINATGNIKLFKTIFQNSAILGKFYDKLKIPALKKLDIGSLNLDYKLVNGRFEIDSILLPLENASFMKFSGYTSLDKSINYAGRISVLRSGIANNIADQLLKEVGKSGLNIKPSDRMNIGFLISGDMMKPKITFSLKEIKNNFKETLKKELDNKAEAGIKKAMDEARKKAQSIRDLASATANTIRLQGKKNANLVREKAKISADKVRLEGKKANVLILQEADKQVNDLVNKATNPIAKIAAKKVGERVKSEAKKKADEMNVLTEKKALGIENIGESNALKVEEKAEIEAKKVEDKANEQADNVLRDAENKAKNSKNEVLK